MRTRQLQFMRPDEILEAKQEKSIVYLPLGPLEWHSYHMPFGTDPIQAEMVALRTAEKTGGVVMPTLYCGTEGRTNPEVLKTLGLEDPERYVVGVDYPKNTVKSFYTKEEVFGVIVSEYIRLMEEQGYRLIVLVNGHGGSGQMATLERLADEYSNEGASRVLNCLTLMSLEEYAPDLAHAGKVETAIQRYYNDDNVDLSRLPERSVKLRYTDWGIVDCRAFLGSPTEDKTVEADPRDATVEQGRAYVQANATILAELVEKEYSRL